MKTPSLTRFAWLSIAAAIATILLTVMAPVAVEFALKFGPAEYFAVMVLAFTTVSAVLGASAVRG